MHEGYMYCYGVTENQGGALLPIEELVAQVTVDASGNSAAVAQFEFLNGENVTTIFKGKKADLLTGL